MATPTKAASSLTQSILLICLLVQILCSSADDSDVTEQERTQKEYPQGIARLLFKHMRFRALPEVSDPEEEQSDLPDYGPWSSRTSDPDMSSGETTFHRRARHPPGSRYWKREQQELVNNLAALLAETNRGKNSASTLRMPSLRFG